MKVLICPVCGEENEVDDRVKEVICAECLITKEAPVSRDGIDGYAPSAFLRLVSAGIDDWEVSRDRKTEEVILFKRFNNLRIRRNSLIQTRNKLNIPWRKIRKLEAYRLLKKGWRRKDIAKELEVNRRTVYRWNETFRTLLGTFYPRNGKNVTFGSRNELPEQSSKMEFQGNGNQIDYNFSSESLDRVANEDAETYELVRAVLRQ